MQSDALDAAVEEEQMYADMKEAIGTVPALAILITMVLSNKAGDESLWDMYC